MSVYHSWQNAYVSPPIYFSQTIVSVLTFSFAESYMKWHYFVTTLTLVTLQGSACTQVREVVSFNTPFSIHCCSYVPNLTEIWDTLTVCGHNMQYIYIICLRLLLPPLSASPSQPLLFVWLTFFRCWVQMACRSQLCSWKVNMDRVVNFAPISSITQPINLVWLNICINQCTVV